MIWNLYNVLRFFKSCTLLSYASTEALFEVGQDALAFEEKKPLPGTRPADDLETNERLVLESGAIVFTFETGSGNNTMPLMLIETDIDLQMFNWSRNVSFHLHFLIITNA